MDHVRHTDGVLLDTLLAPFELENFTPGVDTSKIMVNSREVTRPSFQLTGYFEGFTYQRILVIGNVEYNYILKMGEPRRREIFEKMFSYDIPCLIYCAGHKPDESTIKMAQANNVPLYGTEEATSPFIGRVITDLGEYFAPCTTVHGVLVDIYGEGLLIMGESGIGKSEAALELIRRGHRLVADDVVEVRRITEKSLVGSSPPLTKYFMEVRGIGIIDVKTLFGVESIMEKTGIDMVIKLEEWNKETEFDRLGLKDEYTNFLGLDVVCQSVPVRPGRNLAVILEAAAANHRQKKMGYNAAVELVNRAELNAKKED